jgi:hypothetical protein
MEAKVFKFAQAGSMCGDLNAQTQRLAMSTQVPRLPGGNLKPETLVIVHTCGNDFIMKVAQGFMGGGNIMNAELLQPEPGAREAVILKQFMETLYRMGARHFLVSGVPIFVHMPIFNIAWPILGGLVNSGALENLGVSPGDPPQLAMEVQAAALQDRWVSITSEFGKEHPESNCVLFDEVEALEKLRNTLGAQNFDMQMWDFSMFHPSPFGHEQIAGEAHRCIIQNISALQSPSATATPAAAAVAAPRPALSTASPGYVATAAPLAAAAVETSKANNNITLRLRNVKGDVSFSLACDPKITVAELKDKVRTSAPAGFAPPGATCLLALQGKFLEDPKGLHELNVVDNTQLIVVMKAT